MTPSGLREDDLRCAMQDKGWLTVTQIAGMVSRHITPEAAVRVYMASKGLVATPIAVQVSSGYRTIVNKFLFNLHRRGKVAKHGSGKGATYRWIKDQDGSSGLDSP